MKSPVKPKKYVTDRNGRKVAVVLSIKDYQKLLDEVEELESIRAFDTAVAAAEQPIPFDDAVREIERNRK